MKKVFILFVLIVFAIFFESCRKEKKVENPPFIEIDWRINNYYFFSDPTWITPPFPDWKLKFNMDKTFVLDLGNNNCTGRYEWKYTDTKGLIELKFKIDSWNIPPAMSVEGNKIKEIIESTHDCHFYYREISLTINGIKGRIDAQTL
ncbi:hypothetical protein [Paracnuella aquatica]|uniref:hypothetical protein n=1 Tax=Paracnuella aquatica TaxID=2268757 RepID=UPI000DEF4859|nr:hypothetical protein [Paracnuella aquatica]RPD43362.1 hypothetical protein DRJ53_20490 [Paracnuella aquatica]